MAATAACFPNALSIFDPTRNLQPARKRPKMSQFNSFSACTSHAKGLVLRKGNFRQLAGLDKIYYQINSCLCISVKRKSHFSS
jgi:hypothetical protein